MPPAFLLEDSRLISDLLAIAKKSPKLVKSSVYPAPVEPNILIQSWKMNEFKYYDIPSPFPTLARGLYTTEVSESEYGVKHRIVARGYDKFFNIGEVPWTTWEALEANTTPPYTLSLKSNGCIIFIAALTPKKLVITSKHSIGPVSGVKISHAEMGERWLRRYFEEKGRTEEEFAARLWEENWTAVAELCDDSFEEHVLPYPPERTGLHLHGINVATKDFKTMPHEIVDTFAEEWGFIKTRTHVVNSIQEVREFTSHVGEIGEWEGEVVEGFVVRTHVAEPGTDSRPHNDEAAKGNLPYAPGSSFFFKIKFDEPYMMYRDWRELTKKLLSTKGALQASSLPRGKMKRKETKVYVNWVIEEIKNNRKQFDGYTKGHGIIATRERFLKWYEQQKASGKVEEEGDKTLIESTNSRVIIVPVAVPGCGKTSVGVALTHLFNFGHTQSDDVTVKKAAPVFLKHVQDLLHKQSVVIADKNNHLRQHRQQLREIARQFDPPARLIALNWSSTDKPPAIIHQICSDRIVDRGSNHQTLVPSDASRTHYKDVLWMFLNTREALTGDEVDECIDMEIEDDLETMVKSAVDGLWKLIGGDNGLLGNAKPNETKIKEALEHTKEYKVKKSEKASPSQKQAPEKAKKGKAPRYYGLLPDFNLEDTVKGALANVSNGSSNSGVQFLEKLKKTGRVVKQPHVTIVHQKELPQRQNLWGLSESVVASMPPPVFKIKFGRLLWDGKVMVLTVDGIEEESGAEAEKNNFFDALPLATRTKLHVTVGTANDTIPPVEGMKLTQRWRSGEREKEGVFESEFDQEMFVTGRLKGLMS